MPPSSETGTATSDERMAFEGAMIAEIAVEGNKRIEADAIRSKILLKVGEPLTAAAVRDAIYALHDAGYFAEIALEGDEAANGQVKVAVAVKERPVIAEIEFEGNDQIGTSDLREVTKVKEWSIFDLNSINADVERLQKHYEDKGYFLAKVRPEITPNPKNPDEVVVTYKIKDYDKVTIKRIDFLNNKRFTDDQLKAVLAETREGGALSFLSGSGNYKEAAFKQDLQRLTLFYLDQGYVKFRYENPQVTVSDDKQSIFISISVDEGDPYTIGNVDFSGELLFSKEELLSELVMTQGHLFRITERNQDIQHLTEKYQDLGYAFANVIPKMTFHEENRTIDLDYSFEHGKKVTFGEIIIQGNHKTYDKVIRRELRIHEGELFNGTRLRISRERVERLGYFAPGETQFITVTPKGKDDVVNVEITVKERSTGTITLGAGYGSVSKFFLQTQIQEQNLFGRGQVLSLQAQYAADNISRSLDLSFTDPYAFDTLWSLGGKIFYINFPIPNLYTLRRTGFNIMVGRPIVDDIFAYITYKFESSAINDIIDPTADTSLDNGLLSSIVWQLQRDKRNNRFETTGGTFQSITVETAGLGGVKEFIKYVLNNRFYTRVVGDLVFRNNLEFGHILRTGVNPPPYAERFFLGGPNSLRGYRLFTVSPTNSNGSPTGGFMQFQSMFELEYPIIREAGIKFVTFFDMGNSIDPSIPGSFSLRTNIGWGIRWFSPIGPLRFEFGYPLGPYYGNSEFQFMIGPPF